MRAKQDEADGYRKNMDEEIMPRVYINTMSGKVMGLLNTTSDYVAIDT